MLRVNCLPACLAILLATTAGPALADIRILAVGPMTGPYQALGKQIRAGVETAVDALNAKGGINGERISVDIEDDACKPKRRWPPPTARSDAATSSWSAMSAPRRPSRQRASMPTTSCSPSRRPSPPTAIPTSARGPTLFRLATRDDAQAPTAGAFLAERFGNKRIALLNDGSSYGKPLAEATKQAMNEAGKREARLDTFDPDAKEYNALADRLIADAIDVVFVGGDQGDIALILKALRAKGSPAVVMGGDSLGTSEFVTAAGDAANGTLLTFFTDWRLQPPAEAANTTLRQAGVDAAGLCAAGLCRRPALGRRPPVERPRSRRHPGFDAPGVPNPDRAGHRRLRRQGRRPACGFLGLSLGKRRAGAGDESVSVGSFKWDEPTAMNCLKGKSLSSPLPEGEVRSQPNRVALNGAGSTNGISRVISSASSLPVAGPSVKPR